MHAARLLDAQFLLFKLHQFGHKADIRGNPLSPLGDIGIRRPQRPCVCVDEVGEDDGDGTRFASFAMNVRWRRVQSSIIYSVSALSSACVRD